MPAINSIAWFEIGTDDPAAAERFYGDVFGWSLAHDGTASTDPAYQVFTTGSLRGGLFATRGQMPGYAVFTVLVEATCRRVEEAAGRVQRAPQVNPVGVTFAHLLDPSGNHFAVFSPR